MEDDERDQMTQEEWDEMQNDLLKHLAEVEERFWASVRVPPQPSTTTSQ